MPPSRVIRIDDEVWVELQSRARPLEDTPNSVLRRVFGLPEQTSIEAGIDHRILRLLELLQEAVGTRPLLSPAKKGHALLSATNEPIAFFRSQRDRLRVTVSRQSAEGVGLSDWHRERADIAFSGGSVSWYAPDADDVAYQELTAVVAKLWKHSAQKD
jgi:hypothetical protein